MQTFVLMTKLSPEGIGDPRGRAEAGKAWKDQPNDSRGRSERIAHGTIRRLGWSMRFTRSKTSTKSSEALGLQPVGFLRPAPASQVCFEPDSWCGPAVKADGAGYRLIGKGAGGSSSAYSGPTASMLPIMSVCERPDWRRCRR